MCLTLEQKIALLDGQTFPAHPAEMGIWFIRSLPEELEDLALPVTWVPQAQSTTYFHCPGNHWIMRSFIFFLYLSIVGKKIFIWFCFLFNEGASVDVLDSNRVENVVTVYCGSLVHVDNT